MEKIKVHQVQTLLIALQRIYEVNDVLPSVFDLHMGRLLPELQKINERVQSISAEKYDEIKHEEIELPITKIRPANLPEKIPNDIGLQDQETGQKVKFRTINLLEPVLIQEDVGEYDSGIDSLLKPHKNGKEVVEDFKKGTEEANEYLDNEENGTPPEDE